MAHLHSFLCLLAGLFLIATQVTAKQTSLRIKGQGKYHSRNFGNYTVYPKPADDSFYKVPRNVTAYKPGEIIRSRQIPTTRFGVEADRAYQILYRTNGQGWPDATVATTVAPRFPAPGPPKIVTVVAPENSATINCAPSYTYLPLTTSTNNFEILALMAPQTAIHQGWYALIPDFEGSRSAWLLGHVEGQATLDAMRAIMNHEPTLHNSADARFSISGYSGGAHGGAWAAQLASTYAPELNIVGFVLGGLPADMRNVSAFIDGSPTATLLYLAAAGISNGYPDVERLFSSRVKHGNASALWEQVHDGKSCANIAYQNGPFHMDDGFTKDAQGRTISESPLLISHYEKDKLGKHQPPITKIPGYVLHTSTDEIIPLPQASDYVQGQCDQGAQIEFATIHDGVHIEAGFRAQPAFVRKMQDFFLAAESRLELPKNCQRTEPEAPYPGFNDIGRLLLGDGALRLALEAKKNGFGPS